VGTACVAVALVGTRPLALVIFGTFAAIRSVQ
jgi:hypothetical protein